MHYTFNPCTPDQAKYESESVYSFLITDEIHIHGHRNPSKMEEMVQGKNERNRVYKNQYRVSSCAIHVHAKKEIFTTESLVFDPAAVAAEHLIL
ncbi:hypothetical protein L484_006869 [Morus notabilis]|uniref:Uncharacterized protein n=1 Tax=Morus notabilis TaxID=981085 RepID=W9S7A4_9ROSA|nr:hypothetical protein L484_006869 [Morus notabilis]